MRQPHSPVQSRHTPASATRRFDFIVYCFGEFESVCPKRNGGGAPRLPHCAH